MDQQKALQKKELLAIRSMGQSHNYVQTKASPTAEDSAIINKKMDMMRERMFLGAFVKAYSRPVIDAKISLIATRM